MLISHRGEFGERDPWQTEGGGVTEDVLRALRIPYDAARRAGPRGAAHRQGADARVRRRQARRAAARPRPDVGGGGPLMAMLRLDALHAIYPKLEDRVGRHDHGRRRGRAAVDSATARTSSTCSTRWAWPRRWGSASRSPGPTRQVIVFDGDGSVLMNLGGLTTLARYRPRNLAARRVRQREPAVGRRLPDRDVDRQRPRRHRRGRRRAADGDGPDARRRSRARSTRRWRPAS